MWPVSINLLTDVVARPVAQPRLTKVGHRPNRLPLLQNIFCETFWNGPRRWAIILTVSVNTLD
jgi:hypothetical protein